MIGSGALGMNATDAYDCNVYLLDGGSEQAVFDCGTGYGVAAMIAEAKRDGYDSGGIRTLCLTHGHMDHAGGAALWKAATGAIAAASRETAAMIEAADEIGIGLVQARANGVYPLDCRLTRCDIERQLQHEDELHIGDLTLQVYATPGHSHDIVSYYCPELKALFSGDTVFAGGEISVLNTPDFSMEQLRQSIQLLSRLDVELLLPGHWSPVVRNGSKAIARAASLFERGDIPRSIV
jgi:glyoxylase-like metal-dependent hydrolase (beta-lactamase superfamily II)